MEIVEIIVGIVVILPAVDWLVVTRIAGYYTDFDYRYWPLSKARVISMLSLGVSIAILLIFADPDKEAWWPAIPAGLAIIAWSFIYYIDILAQRRTGYRNPPCYGEREYEE